MTTDEDVVQMMKDHHAALLEGLATRATAVGSAAPGETRNTVAAMVEYVRAEILPHAAAEEAAVYPRAAQIDGEERFIAEMVDEHRVLQRLTDRLATTSGPESAETAATIVELFAAHAGKENDRILPALVRDPSVHLEDVLAEMHDALGH